MELRLPPVAKATGATVWVIVPMNSNNDFYYNNGLIANSMEEIKLFFNLGKDAINNWIKKERPIKKDDKDYFVIRIY